MGVTIHYQLSQKKNAVKDTLDRAQRLAEVFQKQAGLIKIPFTIRRINEYTLLVDMGGCETLAFEFKSVAEINKEAENGWAYMHAVLTDNGKKELDAGYEIQQFPHNEIYYASGFCKTQFAQSLVEHRFIAELIRMVASYCTDAHVSDESYYYNSGKIEDAGEAISSLGKMIDGLAGMFQGLGYEIEKSETKIKNKRRK